MKPPYSYISPIPLKVQMVANDDQGAHDLCSNKDGVIFGRGLEVKQP